MAYDPYPGTPAPNTLADASKLRAQLDALFTPPHAKASSVTAATFPATASALTFDTEDFDNNGMYSTGSPKRITIQTAGLYVVAGYVDQIAGGGDFSIALRKNGTDGVVSGELAVAGRSGGRYANATALARFIVGDYLELAVYHGSPGNQAGYRWLSAVLLGA